MPLDAVQLGTLVGTILFGVGGGIVAIGKWLAGYFDVQRKQADVDRDAGERRFQAMQQSTFSLMTAIQQEKQKEREEFLAALAKQADSFESIVEKTNKSCGETLSKVEAECSRQREADRLEREESRKALFRVLGVSPGDTGKFRKKEGNHEARSDTWAGRTSPR